MKCISGGCKIPAANAIRIGQYAWPDGRPRYTLTCPEHVEKVVTYQASMDVPTLVQQLDQVVIVGPCVACWRSHGCNLPDDHDDEHVCMPGDCDDRPLPDDEVFKASTFEPCARTGGVPW